MLAFDRPSLELDDAYYDSHQSALIYALPNAVRPATRDHSAEMSLALYAAPHGAGGGVFQTRLAPSYPSIELGDTQTLVQARPYSCKWKLTPRSQVEHADSFGNWYEGVFDGDAAFLLNVFLEEHNARLMRQLALSGERGIDLTVDFEFIGLVAGVPYTALFEMTAIHRLLGARFANKSFSRSEFQAVFLSLPAQHVRLTADSGNLSADRSYLIEEAALRVMPFLCKPSDNVEKFEMVTETPEHDLTLSLDTERRELRKHRVIWALSEFVADLSEQEQ